MQPMKRLAEFAAPNTELIRQLIHIAARHIAKSERYQKGAGRVIVRSDVLKRLP